MQVIIKVKGVAYWTNAFSNSFPVFESSFLIFFSQVAVVNLFLVPICI